MVFALCSLFCTFSSVFLIILCTFFMLCSFFYILFPSFFALSPCYLFVLYSFVCFVGEIKIASNRSVFGFKMMSINIVIVLCRIGVNCTLCQFLNDTRCKFM